jgi:hypothetical protein
MIETPEANLIKGMRQLNGVFTQGSNRRHKRSGHLFQGRNKAILVDRDSYFLEFSRYIVLDPVRVAMVKHPRQWVWSSYGALMDKAPVLAWLVTEDLWAQFGNRRARAKRRYQEFIEEGIGGESIWKNLKGQIYLGDDDFVEKMRSKLGEREEDVNIPKVQQRAPAPELNTIRRQYQKRDDEIREAYDTGEYSYQQIAKEFGGELHDTDQVAPHRPLDWDSSCRQRYLRMACQPTFGLRQFTVLAWRQDRPVLVHGPNEEMRWRRLCELSLYHGGKDCPRTRAEASERYMRKQVAKLLHFYTRPDLYSFTPISPSEPL